MTIAGRGGWLLGAVLALAVPACGDSSSGSVDAARTDGPPPTSFDVPIGPNRDSAPVLDVGAKDVGAKDVGAKDAAADASADATGTDVAPGPVLDAAPDQRAVSFDGAAPVDASADGGPDGGGAVAVDATALDAAVEAGPSFCALQQRVDGGTQRRCYDFSEPASAADFVPEAGTWTVSNGSYEAVAPAVQVTCPNGDGSLMTASVLSDLSAKDVRIHAKLTAISSPDKVIVLRSRSGGNRIELNFRANFVFEDVAQGGDLYISALVDCTPVTYVPVATVLIPHAIGQSIVADVQLVGQQLTVAVDGKTVFAGSLPLPTAAGTVGFAAFREAVTQFDDLLIDVLD